MRYVVYSEESLADLEDIWEFVAGGGEEAASRLVQALVDHCQRLAQFPFSHPVLSGFPYPDVRRAVLRPWVILYQVRDTHVEVLRVVFGGRDLSSLSIHP